MCDKMHYEEIDKKVEVIAKDMHRMQGEMASLRQDANISIKRFVADIAEIKGIVNEHKETSNQIIKAWETADGLLTFVKALGKIAAACTAIAAAVYAATHWGGKV